MKHLILSVFIALALAGCNSCNQGPTSTGCQFVAGVDPGLETALANFYSCNTSAGIAAIDGTLTGIEATLQICKADPAPSPSAGPAMRKSSSFAPKGILGSSCTMIVDTVLPGLMGKMLPSTWLPAGCTVPNAEIQAIETVLTIACGLIPATEAQLK
jgi:hypothetical protein